MKITTKTKKGLGHLYKRDSDGKDVPATSKRHGTFWLAYRDSTGKRVKQRLEIDGKPVTDLETARREQIRIRAPILTGSKIDALKKFEADLQTLEQKRAEELDKASPPLSLADAWDAYRTASNRPECGEDTMRYYRTMWMRARRELDSAQGVPLVFVRDVTDAMAGYIMQTIRESGVSANTYNKHLSFYRLFFRVLAKQARMDANPFADIMRRKQAQKSRRELSVDELRLIISSASGEMRLLFEIGTFTGLRFGDCCTLKWDEIDLARMVIRRKPNKTAKSSGAEVTIGIPRLLYELLYITPERDRYGYVLPECADMYNDRTKRTYLSKRIQDHFRACGIATHEAGTGSKHHYEGKSKVYDNSARAVVVVGFHSLRHTYASLHAACGTPQALIQDNMGHSNPGMTEHYTHVNDETARRVAEALNLPELLPCIPGGFEKVDDMRQQLMRLVKRADGALLHKLLQAANAPLIEGVKP